MPGGDLLVSGTGRDSRQTTYAGMVATSFMFLGRTDSLANFRWMRRYNVGITNGAMYPPVLLPDGGALLVFAQVVGTSIFNQIQYAHVGRVDSVGNMLWQHRYGADFSTLDHAVARPDGSYAISGYQIRRSPQNQSVFNAWLLQLKANGDTISNRYWGSLTDMRQFNDLRNTPDGGLLLVGTHVAGPRVTTGTVGRGWLLKLDAQDNFQWEHELVAANPLNSTTGANIKWLSMLQGGDFLIYGFRNQGPNPTPPTSTISYLARWRFPTSGNTIPTPVWERQLSGSFGAGDLFATSPDGSVTTGNQWYDPNPPGYNHEQLRHYASQGLPYQPNLCATPPLAIPLFTQTTGLPQLNFSDISLVGPQYAQIVKWRWEFGDGTSYNGQTPPPHTYANPTPATALRLTVTNNLGCTSTAVEYPFAPLPTRPQRALQAAFTLHPNPAAGAAVTLTLPGLRPQPPVAGELLNSIGQVVRAGRWPVAALAQGAALDVAGLAAGVYTLRLQPQEGPVVARLVRQ